MKLLASAPVHSEIFAGNRAIGRIAFSVAAGDGVQPRAERVHEAGALRVRFPNVNNRAALDAVIVNTAGGMTGGDRFDIGVAVGAGARLTVTTAAAEKVYRSLGPDTESASSSTSVPAARWPGCRRKRSCSIRSGCAARSRSILRPTRACCWPRP